MKLNTTILMNIHALLTSNGLTEKDCQITMNAQDLVDTLQELETQTGTEQYNRYDASKELIGIPIFIHKEKELIIKIKTK